MKNNVSRLLVSALILAAVATGLQSCSKKGKPIEKENGSVQISVPFTESKYQSDKEHFRAKASGSSPDLTTAKKIALQNAKSEMAGLIQTTVKKVTDQYTNQRQIGNVQEFTNKFEELAREVTNQQLTDVKILDEKIFKEQNNTYTFWVAIEAAKETVLNGFSKTISSNKKLEQDYDRKKFEEIFNSEMEKLSKERGY
jgi:hypothetical protein